MNNKKKFAKETYMNNYEDMIIGQNCGSKSFWQLMGRLACKQSKPSSILPLQTPCDSYAFTDSEEANTLNDCFCFNSSIDDTNSNPPEFTKRRDSSLSKKLISPSEVSDILSNLKLNKASGPYGISHRMLKNTSGSIETPFCKLFNLSLKQTCSRVYRNLHMLCHFF